MNTLITKTEQLKRFLNNLSSEERKKWYIRTYSDLAVSQMKKYKIPASITLAQGVLESGNGRSQLASKSNNHFGIKCHTGWKGGRVYHDDDEKGGSSMTRPTESAPTCSFRGTPASNKAKLPLQTAAIDEEPLLSKVSAFIRTAKGNVDGSGRAAASAFSANAPCPTSLLETPRGGPDSFTEKLGNE